MSLVSRKVDEISVVATTGGDGVPRTSLAAVESLVTPLVEEVVLMADLKCSRCQKRVSQIINKINGDNESLVISVVEKKVTLRFTHPKSKRR